jgi:hypothetical protein
MLLRRLCFRIGSLSTGQFFVLALTMTACVFLLGHTVLQARGQGCEWNCEYISCWDSGTPDPPCTDCGVWEDWTEWYNSGYGCTACGAGYCRMYQYGVLDFYSDECEQCSHSFIQQCLSCQPG